MRNLKKALLIAAISALFFIVHNTNAQVIIQEDTVMSKSLPIKTRTFKMTSLAFGGVGLLFTNVNDQFTLMNGGRGSATFNNRFTFGGGGWGMPKGIELESSEEGIYEFFKMGYGGLEFGYILYPGKKIKFGTNLLLGCGAGFKETVPKSKNGDFKMFPVLEPSIYSQISLGKLMRLDLGLTYRYVSTVDFSYISNKNISGFSFYVALLVSTCNCDN